MSRLWCTVGELFVLCHNHIQLVINRKTKYNFFSPSMQCSGTRICHLFIFFTILISSRFLLSLSYNYFVREFPYMKVKQNLHLVRSVHWQLENQMIRCHLHTVEVQPFLTALLWPPFFDLASDEWAYGRWKYISKQALMISPSAKCWNGKMRRNF